MHSNKPVRERFQSLVYYVWDSFWNEYRPYRMTHKATLRLTAPEPYGKPKRAENKKKKGTPSQRKQARRKRAKSSRKEGFQIGIEEPKGFHELNRLRRKKRIPYFAKGGKA
jgi:hypothetical protein